MDSLLRTLRLKDALQYIHAAGVVFIIGFMIVTLLLAFVSGFLFVIGCILTAWCIYFFRDPPRIAPTRAGLIVSPADGRVVAVAKVKPAADLGLGEEDRWRISIFLNIFDVHVNRMPADGKVAARHYRPGKFVNAVLDKASEDNERMALVLELGGDHPYVGKTMGVVQIAGLIARRIVCDAGRGHTYKAGERYGIIRFGSRADVYLPVGVQPLVAVGQYMIGGETVVADCQSSEPPRKGELR
ncbi:MAG: phosphatidylserine decarboxylase [Bdellovibrionales bacterium]